MPVHDWTKVLPGDFHDFHQAWTTEIRTRLNLGVLPSGYFAQIEQVAGNVIADVLTLHEEDDEAGDSHGGGLGIATVPPTVRITAELERKVYDARKNRIAIHHASSNRVVAVIEMVSFGNKSGMRDFRRFVDKAVSTLEEGIHLLIVDLYPPTSRDPEGIHGAIWSELGDDSYRAPPNKPLTQVAYQAAEIPKAFVEPLAIGDELTAMPLILSQKKYVPTPLAEAYAAAFAGVPAHLRRKLQQTLPS